MLSGKKLWRVFKRDQDFLLYRDVEHSDYKLDVFADEIDFKQFPLYARAQVCDTVLVSDLSLLSTSCAVSVSFLITLLFHLSFLSLYRFVISPSFPPCLSLCFKCVTVCRRRVSLCSFRVVYLTLCTTSKTSILLPTTTPTTTVSIFNCSTIWCGRAVRHAGPSLSEVRFCEVLIIIVIICVYNLLTCASCR